MCLQFAMSGSICSEEIKDVEAEEFILVLSTDNYWRHDAEEGYRNMDPEEKVELLLEALCYTKTDMVIEKAAVLLRQFFAMDFLKFYKGWLEEPQAQLLEHLLLALEQPTTPTVIQKVAEVIAEIAEKLIGPDGKNQWKELTNFLLSCAISGLMDLQLAALHIVAAAPDIFITEEMQQLSLIKRILSASLDPTADRAVRHQALRAICVFIKKYDEVEQTVYFKELSDLLPQILFTIAESIDERTDASFFEFLLDIIEMCPRLLRPRLIILFEMCTDIYSTHDQDSWRHSALEVMVALSEQAPAMVRKCAAPNIADFLPHLLKMLTNLKDVVNWNHSKIVGEDTNHTIAKRSLGRLTSSLGGAVILPLVMQALPAMMSHSTWQQRYAGLTAIIAIGDQMQPMLHKIVGRIEASLYDSHPRVRYAACTAVGQMAIDFMPTFARNFHEPILSGLLSVLDDRENPRVQAHACEALGSFCEDCPKEILVRYLDTIMALLKGELNHRIVDLSAQGCLLVLENVILSVACVAKASEQEFVPYYDDLMPILMTIMKDATAKPVSKLRCRAIECVTFLGLAVGPAKFMPDAGEAMNLLMSSLSEGELPDNDPQTPFVLRAWCCLSRSMGKHFNSFLPLIMGPVMSKAAIKPVLKFLDNEEVKRIQDNPNWKIIDDDRRTKVAISALELESKVAATSLLFHFSRELATDFSDYVEEVVEIMVPCLKFYCHDIVRSAAAESLPYLLNCAATKGRDHLERLWFYIFPELAKVFRTEPMAYIQAQLLGALGGCIECVGPNFVFKENVQEVMDIFSWYLREHLKRGDKRMLARNCEDHDDVAEEELLKQHATDLDLLSKLSYIIEVFFETNKAEFIPYFNQVSPLFTKLLNPNCHYLDRQWGLTVFHRIIELCGPACVAYKEVFSLSFLENLVDKKPEVRQAAANGCGALAEHGGEPFAHICALAIAPLMQTIHDLKCEEPANIRAIGNAFATLTKILRYNSSAMRNIDEVLRAWFNWLPFIHDRNVATQAYSFLCEHIDESRPSILGTRQCNLQQIVATIANAFAAGVIRPRSEVGARMLGVINQVKLNPEIAHMCNAIITSDLEPNT